MFINSIETNPEVYVCQVWKTMRHERRSCSSNSMTFDGITSIL